MPWKLTKVTYWTFEQKPCRCSSQLETNDLEAFIPSTHPRSYAGELTTRWAKHPPISDRSSFPRQLNLTYAQKLFSKSFFLHSLLVNIHVVSWNSKEMTDFHTRSWKCVKLQKEDRRQRKKFLGYKWKKKKENQNQGKRKCLTRAPSIPENHNKEHL